jgi:hypothetical protein
MSSRSTSADVLAAGHSGLVGSPTRRFEIVCVACGAASSAPDARGWRGYRLDEPAEPFALAFYCPSCVETKTGVAPRGEVGQGRRWRDADKSSRARFRVVLDAADARAVDHADIESALDAIAAIGGSSVLLRAGGDVSPTRVEFELKAQNEGHAKRLALELLDPLDRRVPFAGGWVFASLSPI